MTTLGMPVRQAHDEFEAYDVWRRPLDSLSLSSQESADSIALDACLSGLLHRPTFQRFQYVRLMKFNRSCPGSLRITPRRAPSRRLQPPLGRFSRATATDSHIEPQRREPLHGRDLVSRRPH